MHEKDILALAQAFSTVSFSREKPTKEWVSLSASEKKAHILIAQLAIETLESRGWSKCVCGLELMFD